MINQSIYQKCPLTEWWDKQNLTFEIEDHQLVINRNPEESPDMDIDTYQSHLNKKKFSLYNYLNDDRQIELQDLGFYFHPREFVLCDTHIAMMNDGDGGEYPSPCWPNHAWYIHAEVYIELLTKNTVSIYPDLHMSGELNGSRE